eukprot:s2852_g15.t4
MWSWTYLLAIVVGLLAVGLHFHSQRHEDRSEHVDARAEKLLRQFVVAGRPQRFRAEELPSAALLQWSPESLAAVAPRLKDVWVKDAQENITRFTYFVASRTLGPLLRSANGSHTVVPEMATRRLLEGCAQDKKRYFYSGLAEGADGLDAKPLVDQFLNAISSLAPAEPPEAKANVWISCPSTGASTHYDLGYNVVLQLYGSKTFELLPPTAFLELQIPPTGHPYARQVLKEGGYNFSSFELQQGDALYVPPLWAHRTTSGKGMSISLNIFIGSAAEQVAERLTTLALPFEASWPEDMMQAAASLYLQVILKEVGIGLEHVAARWNLVELHEEDAANCSGLNIEMATSAKIHNRGKEAASLLEVLPPEHRIPIALDYADDVLLGVLNPKVIRNVVLESLEPQNADGMGRKLGCHPTDGQTRAHLGGFTTKLRDRVEECTGFGSQSSQLPNINILAEDS